MLGGSHKKFNKVLLMVCVCVCVQDIQKVKEQLTCFDVDEAKKAGSMKPSVSNCELNH